ncbi:MAG: hypothetical protein KKA64_02020 [Nanoarchaeota archaeon]|nr:hypothetical protein [Nanoarchaeota archaeon]
MKKEIIIGTIIGLVVGLIIGGLAFSKNVENALGEIPNGDILQEMTGVTIWPHIGLVKTFEGIKIKEFEFNGLENSMGGVLGCGENVCGDAAVFVNSCETFLDEEIGLPIGSFDFYTCRLEGVRMDVDKKVLLGDCKCFYRLKE